MRTSLPGGGSVRDGRRLHAARNPAVLRSDGAPDGTSDGGADRASGTRAGGLPAVSDWRQRGTRPLHGAPAHERGSAAAEFAVAIPVVVLVLGCCLGAIQVASQQVRLTDAAADAARTLARGDPPAVAAARVNRVVSNASMSTSTSGDFVCVLLRSPAGFGPAAIAGVRVQASGCALAGGL